MSPPDLLTICVSAFIAVLLLLSLLALVMRLIMFLFPEKAKGIDPAVMAAVVSTYSAIYPRTRITKIEEEK